MAYRYMVCRIHIMFFVMDHFLQAIDRFNNKYVQHLSNGDYRVEIGGGLKGGKPVSAWLENAAGFAAAHIAANSVCGVISAPVFLINPVARAAVYYGTDIY